MGKKESVDGDGNEGEEGENGMPRFSCVEQSGEGCEWASFRRLGEHEKVGGDGREIKGKGKCRSHLKKGKKSES